MSNVEQIYPCKARSVRATDTDTDRSVQRAKPPDLTPDPYPYPVCGPYPFQALPSSFWPHVAIATRIGMRHHSEKQHHCVGINLIPKLTLRQANAFLVVGPLGF